MKAALTLALLLSCSAGPAWAVSPRVGLVAGDPVALSLSLELTPYVSLELGAGWSPSERRGAVLSVDALGIWPSVLPDLFGGAIDARAGLGARLASSREIGRDVIPGLRVPVALAFVSDTRRWEIFGALAPGADFGARARLSLEGGLGFRAWF